MRQSALGLFAVLACASGCGPLANDPVGDGGGGGGGGGSDGGGSGGGNDAMVSSSVDSGSDDSGGQGGQDTGADDTGAPLGADASGEDSAPPSGDAAPACTKVTTWVGGAGISAFGWTATASATASADGTAAADSITANAFDENLTTRWSSGTTQAGGEFFALDLGQAQSISQVALFYPTTGPGSTDFATAYTLALSTDGSTYTTVATGAGASPTAICFPTQSAQYVKVTQTGTSTSWFSIFELQVFP
jgi:hypothetical protein